MPTKTTVQDTIEYYEEKYKNKTTVPQVLYDAMGNAVTIQPGKTKMITRGRRISSVVTPRRPKRGSGRRGSKR